MPVNIDLLMACALSQEPFGGSFETQVVQHGRTQVGRYLANPVDNTVDGVQLGSDVVLVVFGKLRDIPECYAQIQFKCRQCLAQIIM